MSFIPWRGSTALTLIALTIEPLAHGQERIWFADGEKKGDSFGYAIPAEDLDGDGLPELLVGATNAICPDGTQGSVGVFSVIGGELDRWCEDRVLPFSMVLCADVNGDGIRDCAVGDPFWHNPNLNDNDGRVRIYSVPDGEVLLEYQADTIGMWLGQSIAEIGDLDHDGRRDLLVGAPRYSVAKGKALVLSSASLAVIRQHIGSKDTLFGTAVSGLGDIDGDGIEDYAISAPEADSMKGSVYVFSGATAATIYEFTGEAASAQIGGVIRDPGDWDHDGVPDILFLGSDGTGGHTHINVHSGSTGVRIARMVSEDTFEGWGCWIEMVPDQDRDGFAEILVGNELDNDVGVNAGAATLYSTRTLRKIYKFYPTYGKGLFGVLGPVRDWNGDGLVDFEIGAPYTRDTKPMGGRVSIYAGNDLYLQANDTTVGPADTVTLDTRAGTPGALTLLAIVDISGTDVFYELLLTTFDANGEATFSACAGDDAVGYDFTVLAYAQRDAGRSPVIESSPVTIKVR